MQTESLVDFDDDNQSVISDFTDPTTFANENATMTTVVCQEKYREIVGSLETQLGNLTLDQLKNKCRECNIPGISKLKKKADYTQALVLEFDKLNAVLLEKKLIELKNIAKQSGIKGVSISKKEVIVNAILQAYGKEMRFRIGDNDNSGEYVRVEPKKSKKSEVVKTLDEEDDVAVAIAVEKVDVHTYVVAENVEHFVVVENVELPPAQVVVEKVEPPVVAKNVEPQVAAEEAIPIIESSSLGKKIVVAVPKYKVLEEISFETARELLQKEEIKRKKQAIPKNIRTIIWNHYIGEDIIKHKCLCCKKVTIQITGFDVGHVLSEKNGGTHEINNLRPICGACNHSMGTENMIDFVKKYGLYIG